MLRVMIVSILARTWYYCEYVCLIMKCEGTDIVRPGRCRMVRGCGSLLKVLLCHCWMSYIYIYIHMFVCVCVCVSMMRDGDGLRLSRTCYYCEMPRISLEGTIVPLLAVIYIYTCVCLCVCVSMMRGGDG